MKSRSSYIAAGLLGDTDTPTGIGHSVAGCHDQIRCPEPVDDFFLGMPPPCHISLFCP